MKIDCLLPLLVTSFIFIYLIFNQFHWVFALPGCTSFYEIPPFWTPQECGTISGETELKAERIETVKAIEESSELKG